MSQFINRALRLRERGYTVVAVKAGQKRPMVDGWQMLSPTEKDIREWGKRDYKHGNIGINTRFNPAVDIDVYDADAAQELEDWIADQLLGHELCVRVGRAPKRAIVFRATEEFRKLQATYTDGTTEHKLEILGAGQQFVAYGVHPDTKAPYEWVSMDEPLNMDSADLPELTLEFARDILDKFCLIAEARGWEKLTKHAGAAAGDSEGGLETFKPVLAISRETVKDTLDLLPNNDAPFDTWLEVGMALHHQFGGDTDGLEIWHDWSAESGKCEPAEVNRRWESFGHGPATVTFATLLKRAKDVKAQAADRLFEKTLNRATTCNNKKTLMTEILPELARSFQTEIQFDTAVSTIQTRLKTLDEGAKVRADSIRKALKEHIPKAKREKDVPRWCDNWVYVQVENNFYNVLSGAKFSSSSFDRTYGRELISEAHRAKGEAFAGKASDWAMNLYRIPVVYDYLYFPGGDEFFTFDGMPMVNTYNVHKVPASNYTASRADQAAIAAVERHFEILIKDDRERNLLLDYLAYNVQYPSERVHWAPVLQGVDGGGKSFVQALMAAVMGSSNVGIASAGDLHEQYTGWAEGKKLVFFEEVAIKGNDKYEIVNKVKAFITNATVLIRRMHRDSYAVPNMTNYFIFTNYIDAVPYDSNDRRYFVLRTTFLTSSHIAKFIAENPSYFEQLFRLLGTHYQALRWWLDNRPLSEEFNPKGHAPRTEAWEIMFDAANTIDEDEHSEVDLVIAKHSATNPLLSYELLSLEALKSESEQFIGMNPRNMGRLLSKLGFVPIGRYRLGGRDDINQRFYTKHSEVFARGNTLDTIRRLVAEKTPDPLDGLDDGLD